MPMQSKKDNIKILSLYDRQLSNYKISFPNINVLFKGKEKIK